MSECRCWRKSNTVARGEKMPNTIETLQAAWDRDQELIFEQKAEIERLKRTVNDLRQKINKR